MTLKRNKNMLECKKCNGQYRYINGLFHCNSCGDFADTCEEIERFTLELYNCAYFSNINMEGKLSFLGGEKIEDNPYKDKNEDFSIMWEEGWKEGEEEHNKFMKIQELEEENGNLEKEIRQLEEHILSQTQVLFKEIERRNELKKRFMDLIKKINSGLFPFVGKLFRFGQSEVVDEIGNSLSDFIDEVEEMDKKEEVLESLIKKRGEEK
jgi:hypothetical protein